MSSSYRCATVLWTNRYESVASRTTKAVFRGTACVPHSWLSIVATLCIACAGQAQSTNGIQWSIDKREVSIYGCVTLILNGEHLPLRSIQLHVNGQRGTNLTEVGPSVEHGGRTYVLSVYDFSWKNDLASSESATTLFSDEGTATLSFDGGGIATHEEKVIVKKIDDLAVSAAKRFLFPAWEAPSDQFYWMRLVADAGASGLDRESEKFSYPPEELEAIQLHPDWAQIMPVLLSDRDCKVALREWTREVVAAARGNGDIPSTVQLEAKMSSLDSLRSQSAFASALRDKVTSQIKGRLSKPQP